MKLKRSADRCGAGSMGKIASSAGCGVREQRAQVGVQATGGVRRTNSEKEPPRALRLEYSPERKKLRYNTGTSGWQELDAVERPQKPAVFETPYHQEYSVEELSNLVLAELKKSPL